MDGLWWRTPLLAGKKRQGTTSTILYVRQPGGHGAIQGSVKRGCHGHGEVRRYLQLPFFAPQSVQERARKHAKGERGARGQFEIERVKIIFLEIYMLKIAYTHTLCI
jgi:hypothetical protein